MDSIHTLGGATVPFLLKDPTVSNEAIAQRLLLRCGKGGDTGEPICIFYRFVGIEQTIVAIRTNVGEVVVFRRYDDVVESMEKLATRVWTS